MSTHETMREYKGKRLVGFPDDYVVIDIETTGFNPKLNEIIEIGAVKVRNNKITSVFQSMIKPKNPISPYVSSRTGITNHILADASPIEAVLDSFVSFISDAILISHNVDFDVNFLYDHCETYLSHHLSNNFIDLRELFRKQQSSVIDQKITNICEKCALQNTHAHRALSDCLAAYDLYQSLKSHKGPIKCVEELDTFTLASEFKKNHSPYKKKCQQKEPGVYSAASIS